MNKSIKYTTISEQIELLESRGLIIDNKQLALNALRNFGYYNIINSYKEPYIIQSHKGKIFKPNTTFSQILSLFFLDHNLRNAIMISMLEFEEHLRAVTADVIAQSFGPDISNYLNYRNYQNRAINDSRYNLKTILSTLQNLALKSQADPIKYYRINYNNVPPWILLKGSYFGTLVNYIRLFKPAQKELLIQNLFGLPHEISAKNEIKLFLDLTLLTFLNYRNRAAHGGRIYNYNPKLKFDITSTQISELSNYIKQFPEILSHPGIIQICDFLQLYQYKTPHEILSESINREVDSHLSNYPDDISILENVIGGKIDKIPMVWVSHVSRKYHSNQHCGTSKTLELVSFDYALQNGYTPCKKCFH